MIPAPPPPLQYTRGQPVILDLFRRLFFFVACEKNDAPLTVQSPLLPDRSYLSALQAACPVNKAACLNLLRQVTLVSSATYRKPTSRVLIWTGVASAIFNDTPFLFPAFKMPPKKLQSAKSAGSAANTSRKRKMDPNAQKYYAVRAGKKPGIYLTWIECQAQTAGFKGAQCASISLFPPPPLPIFRRLANPCFADKSFISRDDAEAFVEGRNMSTATDGTKEERYYAVAVGRDPGIYTDWESASLAIKGWKGPKYKRFDTREDALEFIRAHGDQTAQEMLREEEGEEGEEEEEDEDDEEEEEEIEPPTKKTKKGPADTGSNIQCIYTDGSSRSNGRAGAAAGVGVYFGAGDPRFVAALQFSSPYYTGSLGN